MATICYLLGSNGTTKIYLNNSTGLPTPGGNSAFEDTTPFAISSEWTLTRPGRLDNWVDETIPLVYWGLDRDSTAAQIDALRTLVSDPTTGSASFVIQPNGALSAETYGVYWIDTVQEKPFPNTMRSPSEGALIFLVDLTFRRTAEASVTIFEQLLG